MRHRVPALVLVLLNIVLLAFVACSPGGNGEGPVAVTPAPGVAPPAHAPSSVDEAETAIPVTRAMAEPGLNYNARQGRVLFRHYCATCHGEEGHGDGFNAYSLDPKPRDLADAAFQARHSDDDLAAVIRSGGGVNGFSTAMPPWGRSLSERDIRNLVKYIRVLTPSTE